MKQFILIFIILAISSMIYGQSIAGLQFTLINADTAYEVSRSTESVAEIVIPSIYNGLPVIQIPDNGFLFSSPNYSFTSITIPNSIVVIGSNAFSRCNGLTIYAEAHGKPIDWVSNWNPANRPVYWGHNNGGIPGLQFHLTNDYNSYQVQRTTVTVDNIELPAVYNGLPVTHIPNDGFLFSSSNYSFSSITIPNSIVAIGSNAFSRCNGLTIHAEAHGKPIDWVSNWNPANRPVYWSTVLDNDGFAFTSLGIPTDSYEVFRGIWSGSGFLDIPTNFNGLPVTSIRHSGFSNYAPLQRVFIPNIITHIGENAFSTNSALMIYAEATNQPEGWHTNWNPNDRLVYWDVSFDNLGLAYSPILNGTAYSVLRGKSTNPYLPVPDVHNGLPVTEVPDYGFEISSGIDFVNLPGSLTKIGASAFVNSTDMTRVFIPISVENIEAGAFAGCTSLTIFAQAPSQPSGWHPGWNPNNRSDVYK